MKIFSDLLYAWRSQIEQTKWKNTPELDKAENVLDEFLSKHLTDDKAREAEDLYLDVLVAAEIQGFSEGLELAIKLMTAVYTGSGGNKEIGEILKACCHDGVKENVTHTGSRETDNDMLRICERFFGLDEYQKGIISGYTERIFVTDRKEKLTDYNDKFFNHLLWIKPDSLKSIESCMDDVISRHKCSEAR